MALTCGEVMYGAYYPYLYGRGAARYHAPPFQYERFGAYGAHGAAAGGGGGAQSPGGQSPHAPRLRAKEEDLSAHGRASADASSESEGECSAGPARRAQYVSANCVVFTHYAGDAAACVDEHFARALAQDKHKEVVPMVSRNLPASFFNALAMPSGGGGAGGCMELYEYDPWAQHYGSYPRDYHPSSVQGYGGLLLGRSMPQYKPVEWPHAQPHAHLEHAHHAPHCAPYSYSSMTGLEAPVQDGSKDLYWF